MGFRNIHNFNVKMMGKQGWRLMMNLESLVARFYKVRYYSTGSLISAKLEGNPSYI